MTELVWINGQIHPLAGAGVGVEDRGFQFGDGVYETLRVYAGRLFAWDLHYERLVESCRGVEIDLPGSSDTLHAAVKDLLHRAAAGVTEAATISTDAHDTSAAAPPDAAGTADVATSPDAATAVPAVAGDAMLYLQVTRGQAPRNLLYPPDLPPTVLFYARALPATVRPGDVKPTRLLGVPDDRWGRCWIKSLNLLPNVLARNAASRAGCDEAIFIEDGLVREGASSNLFVVRNDVLITPAKGPKILPGVTRALLLELAADLGLVTAERDLPLDEALRADEAFIASSIRELAWVNRWDDQPIGTKSGPGPITRRLHEAYRVLTAAGD